MARVRLWFCNHRMTGMEKTRDVAHRKPRGGGPMAVRSKETVRTFYLKAPGNGKERYIPRGEADAEGRAVSKKKR